MNSNQQQDPENIQNNQRTHKCRLTKTALLLIVIFSTSCFFVVELVVGYLTKSNALVADSFHMLSNIISLIIGLIALRFSKKTSCNKNTFGWGRAEILGSLVNSVFLLALCFTIVVQSVKRFVEPESLEKIDLILGVGAVGLLLNLISLLLFGIQTYQERLNGNRKQKMNMNLQGVFFSALGDSLGSVAVVVSGILVKFVPPLNETKGWKVYVDPVLSLIIATTIMFSIIPLLRKSSHILLQGVPMDCSVEELRNKIFSIAGIVNVHHFYVWSLNAEKTVASAHVTISGEKDEKRDWETVEKVKRLLHKNNIHFTTIQLEHDDVSLDSCDEGCPEYIKKEKIATSNLAINESSQNLIRDDSSSVVS